MKMLRQLVLLLAMMTISVGVSAQQTVKGSVKDSNGDPIVGADVLVKGQSVGTVTDVNGAYSIPAPGNAVLQVSFMGYVPQEVQVNNRTVVDVVLEEDKEFLDEVVVVGYGTQRKVSTTGSVTKVEGTDIARMNVTNATKALQGISPGITIMDRGGLPGADDPAIYLRGVGTTGDANPLILVDGIEMSLSQIPTSDIESISVLKDASSTSIYGSRAAHGVILVTTKRGQSGKAKVSYDGSVGVQDRAVKSHAVSAREYIEMLNESYVNAGGSAIYTEEDIKDAENGTDPYRITYHDWVAETFKPKYITQHNLSLNGGNDDGRYLISANYLDQPGLVKTSEYKRYSFRVNTDFKISKMFRFSADMSFRHTDWARADMFDPYVAYCQDPILPIYYADGRYRVDDQQNNIVASTDYNISGKHDEDKDVLYGQGKIEFEPVKGLVFTGMASYTGGWDRTKEHGKNAKFYDETGENLVTQWNTNNYVYDERNQNTEITLRFLANYKKKFGNHEISILGGAEQISYRNEYVKAQRRNLISDNLGDVSLGSASAQYAYGYPTKWGINSFFGRINYSFKDRYLFEANIRDDGSSRFAQGKKWGVFPSFSAGWRISEENFLRGNSVISNLKVRASWGQTGNESITAFMYLPQYTTANVVINSALTTGVYQQQMANPDVTWETVEQTDLGIDFGLLDNRITGEFDWYRKDTKDILLALGIPKFIGLDAPYQNAGVVRNQGFEFSLGYRDTFKHDLHFNVNGNIAFNKNEWVDRGGDDRNIDGYIIQTLGSQLNSIYIYQADGLIANDSELAAYKAAYSKDPRGMEAIHAGDVKLVDVNGDGTIDADDRVIHDSNIPKITYGMKLGLDWKGWDLNVLLQGSLGGYRMLSGEWNEGPAYAQYTSTVWLDRWTESNQDANASMPRLASASNINTRCSNTFFLQKTNYLRVKNVDLGYTFPSAWTDKVSISRLRLYMSGSNLFTYAPGLVKGIDPEENNGSVTGGTIPPLKIINFGVNIDF